MEQHTQATSARRLCPAIPSRSRINESGFGTRRTGGTAPVLGGCK